MKKIFIVGLLCVYAGISVAYDPNLMDVIVENNLVAGAMNNVGGQWKMLNIGTTGTGEVKVPETVFLGGVPVKPVPVTIRVCTVGDHILCPHEKIKSGEKKSLKVQRRSDVYIWAEYNNGIQAKFKANVIYSGNLVFPGSFGEAIEYQWVPGAKF